MASRIDGTAIAKSIRAGLKAEIEQTQQTNPRYKPNLVIFQGKQIVTAVITVPVQQSGVELELELN
jgi:5,10-methylene-tetrahydrofolate dehydrogenase/methenyl tetrahydrofolate cyclohydrolase